MNKATLTMTLIALLVIAAVMYFFLRSPKVEGFSSLSKGAERCKTPKMFCSRLKRCATKFECIDPFTTS